MTNTSAIATQPEHDALACDQSLPLPDRRIDAAVHRRFRGFVLDLQSGPCADGIPIPHYSSSLDAVIDLTHEVLPGWIYRVATCSLTDDVWLMPDSCHPDLGSGFLERWPDEQAWLDRRPGMDASFKPTPRAAMSLLAILIEVIDAMEQNRAPELGVPAARTLFAAALEARLHPYR